MHLRPVNPANRFGLDYAAEAERLGPPPVPVIDVHTHINGEHAAAIFRRACDLYGVERICSMTHLEGVEAVQRVLGDRIRFIAIPNFADRANIRHHMGEGFLERIEKFHAIGSRIVKFWVAPRSIDMAREMGDPGFMRLDAPLRLRAMEKATDLGMIFMTHVADPDTWFATKYSDESIYGSKRAQYDVFEAMLDRFEQPWIAAHMGGWPENLAFLHGLLDRHDNLYLDCSATKWQVRELSKHPREELVSFLTTWRERILFGSDIVTSDQHLRSVAEENEMTRKASSEDEAFDLYASRYWAYRVMFETDCDGESPIADPDLALVDPKSFTDMDAPQLVGRSLPADLLRDLYRNSAAALLDEFER